MDIGDILNVRNAADHMRHQMQHPMRMDVGSYGMNNDHQPISHQIHDHNAMYSSMGHPQHNNQLVSNHFTSTQHDHSVSFDGSDFLAQKSDVRVPAKAFACSTCSKGFARRSDLARHERIHSGVRPHTCDHPGCGKKFIQRSALTVHARVHTGEKPHMCERCGKPFSDSSSLARHRRIHSGKRPYKCPYANCQKTFTRRTTLTRHQSHHTGTIEQAAAETNAKLSISNSAGQPSIYGSTTSASSPNSSASPTDRPLSESPNQDMPHMHNMHNLQRQGSTDYNYLSQTSSLPPHMRHEYSQDHIRHTSIMNGSSLLQQYSSAPHQRRPQNLTSHPTSSQHANYNPPQPLEPPANGTNSCSASPHMTALGWGSPSVGAGGHGALPSPAMLADYAYPDPNNYPGTQAGHHNLYYPGSNIRRPQSTEPEDYGLRPRTTPHHALPHHMTGHVPMTADWSSMPIAVDSMKEERFVL